MRHRRGGGLLVGTALALLPAVAATEATAAAAGDGDEVQRIVLTSPALHLEMTPSLGGRVLVLQLHGQPNFLKVGAAVKARPRPQVDAQAEDIAYLGHDVWLGPQSGWWLQQQVNPQRRAQAANWPPDPYLAFAETAIEQRSARAISVRGIDSPVSGVRLRKHVALADTRVDTVNLTAEARNIRDEEVAWDLWFNTRVHADTRVFVPIARREDIRLQRADTAAFAEPAHEWNAAMLTLDSTVSPRAQRGKFLIQPSAGWMAGFRGGQALVIRFAHQPLASIHPEHGQVELYLDAPAQARDEHGLLEMEVHAPYRELAPRQTMQAREAWTLLRYDGPDDAQAQRRFLCAQARELALAGACPAGE